MSAIYLNDNGRCTCAGHAGEYLRKSITENPDAQYHKTPLETWERFHADEIRSYGLDCDECAR
jgi:hypothetical protein